MDICIPSCIYLHRQNTKYEYLRILLTTGKRARTSLNLTITIEAPFLDSMVED